MDEEDDVSSMLPYTLLIIPLRTGDDFSFLSRSTESFTNGCYGLRRRQNRTSIN